MCGGPRKFFRVGFDFRLVTERKKRAEIEFPFVLLMTW